MRSAAPVACLLFACCALPPRVDDRSTPVKAYETFKGAVARGEHAREWSCLSRGLRRRLGLKDRAEWGEARVVVLDQGHILIRGICRSEVDGGPKPLADGRVLLDLDFPLGYEGRVWMRSAVVLRAYLAGDEEPVIKQPLDRLALVAGERPGEIIVKVPPETMEYIAVELGEEIVRFEVVREWYLDDFAAGDETPGSIRKDLDTRGNGP